MRPLNLCSLHLYLTAPHGQNGFNNLLTLTRILERVQAIELLQVRLSWIKILAICVDPK